MQNALHEYENGNTEKAKELLNEAYFGPFESERMEQAIRINISSKRAAEIEFQFNSIRKKMIAGEDVKIIEQEKMVLMDMLNTDANALLKMEQGAGGMWLYSFLIIVREGLEAILVISAIVAYLIKSGNASRVKEVYQSTFVALLASVITAYLFHYLFKFTGQQQEVLEGAILLIAMVVLFSMGYWMFRNADPNRWKTYLEGKIQDSLTNRKRFLLWFAVFLAVYREGAETVLFYQALLADASEGTGSIWLGFVSGSVLLVFLFYVIRFTSTRLPLKPFFIISGALLYLLAFIFAGEGVAELQEGGWLSHSEISGFPVITALGIYPSWEGIILQSVIVAAMAFALLFRKKNISKSIQM